jgi:hypothetical protein
MDFLRLKRTITIIMVVSHLLTFFWLIILYFMKGFAYPDLTTSIAMLLPLFAGFTTSIIKDAIAEATPGAAAIVTRQLPWNYGFLMLMFCGSFSVYLLLIVTLKGFNLGFNSFDEFKMLLAASETAFGIYVGYMMPILFTHGGPQVVKPPAGGVKTGPTSAIVDTPTSL